MTVSDFYLLRPQDLPTSARALAPEPGGAAAAALATVLDGPRDRSDEEELAVLRAALRTLGFSPAEVAVVTDDPEESAGNRANDSAFRFVRVRGEVSRVLTHSVLQGYATLLEEALTTGTDLSPERWWLLRGALRQLLRLVSGDVTALHEQRGPGTPRLPARPTAYRNNEALRRWTRGHHVFMVIVQGLVITLNGFAHHARRGEIPEAQRMLEVGTVVMWGAEGALRFTGDFPYSEYQRSIRPTLMPPTAPPDMSGLRWRDHEYLVRVLAGMRSLFARLDPQLEPQRARFLEAFTATYDSHRSVCAHFVGTEQTSVLMATRSSRSAVSTLEHFKRVRSGLMRAREQDRGDDSGTVS
ncbi:hypothetical protein LX15_001505 [Streptoalloteichus tenebrarius]|uniref:Uncharacterized protein n=1 Tax=Streptoalloteichus tenebrarius (strain ATCC 17920 / DSM 40477 / JCM 4838 / CBS 697.72 / NBRC 16177 / NCIMB 11028 / NRRL B-12390 / A12253. 1 / ISP 5477) TaxID=1933 RepID=A0ABT1HQN0_STRSD|nr:hypothetical protein [Streptoalloteichus tenebrarius]MCP2257819.1 hypothetical protein [Streptoalloteichus tenebrarius]